MSIQIFQKEYQKQYLATFIVQLVALVYGIAIGFTGPNLQIFKSDKSPLKYGKITIEQESYISSIATFGSIAAVLCYGWFAEKFGRKTTILMIGIPQTLSWIIMSFADSVEKLYISRLLSGIAGAGCFYVIPVYVMEIASKDIRGSLSVLFSIICNIGIFVEFIIAEYTDFRNAAIFVALVSVVFMIGFSFMPESPQYLITQGKMREAEVAFKFFRGQKPNEILSQTDQEDFNAMQENPHKFDSESKWRTFMQHLSQRGTMKVIIIAFIVAQFPAMSGFFVLITFNQGIFQAAEASLLSVFWSSLAFAVIQIIASIITAKYVDQLGRRKILICSSFATAFSLAIFGGYMILKLRTSVDLSSISWIAPVSLLVQIFVSSVGIIPVPTFYVPELLDQKIRGFVVSMCALWLLIEGFLLVMFYPLASEVFGIDTVMIFFACTSCFCGIFTISFLPETKGRNLLEIADSFRKAGGKKVYVKA